MTLQQPQTSSGDENNQNLHVQLLVITVFIHTLLVYARPFKSIFHHNINHTIAIHDVCNNML